MILYKLNKVLEAKELSQYWLCKTTKIRPGTINAYFHGYVRRIVPSDLDKICKALECDISDLIEYIPDKK